MPDKHMLSPVNECMRRDGDQRSKELRYISGQDLLIQPFFALDLGLRLQDGGNRNSLKSPGRTRREGKNLRPGSRCNKEHGDEQGVP